MEFSRVQLKWEVFEPFTRDVEDQCKKGWESEAEEAQDTLKSLGMNADAADSETPYTSLFT